jgi:hypothetical protein
MKLLAAMYRIDFPIAASEIKLLIAMADFYRALPTLSKAMTEAIRASSHFSKHLGDFAWELLEPAKRLRNQLLFHECYVHAAGKLANGLWVDYNTGNRIKKHEDPTINHVLSKGVFEICCKVRDVERKLFVFDQMHDTSIPNPLASMNILAGDPFARKVLSWSQTDYWALLLNLRADLMEQIVNHGNKSEAHRQCYVVIQELFMKNSLRLGKHLSSGKSGINYFLFAELKDADVPWDSTEYDF